MILKEEATRGDLHSYRHEPADKTAPEGGLCTPSELDDIDTRRFEKMEQATRILKRVSSPHSPPPEYDEVKPRWPKTVDSANPLGIHRTKTHANKTRPAESPEDAQQ